MATFLRPEVVIKHTAAGAEICDTRTGLALAMSPTPGCDIEECVSREAVFVTLGFYEDLSATELLDRQWPVWKSLQAESRDVALQEMIAYTIHSIPFYRSLFNQLGPPCGVEDLVRFPLMSKDDLRQSFYDLTPDGLDIAEALATGRLSAARTSGTTGERLQVLVDMQVARVPPNYEQVWRTDFETDQPRTAILTTPNCTNLECRLGVATMAERMPFTNTLICNSSPDIFSAPDSLIENIVSELWIYRPHILLVNPVYAHWIARRAQAIGISFPPITLVLSTYQYLSNFQRRGLSEILQAPVYNTYTATELAGFQLGVECQYGSWHVREDHCIMEVVDNAGVQLPANEIGLIAATTWAAKVVPLLRYLPGDLGCLIDEPCRCALCGWQRFELHGRATDTVQCADKSRLTTKQLDEILSKYKGIDFYQCHQRVDKLDLTIIPSRSGDLDIQVIRDILHCEVRLVDRLVPASSLKIPLICRN